MADYTELNENISDLRYRNEKYQEILFETKNSIEKLDDELSQDLRRMDSYINSSSISSVQRAKYEERRSRYIKEAMESADSVAELRNNIEKEIDDNNQKIKELQQKIEEENKLDDELDEVNK